MAAPAIGALAVQTATIAGGQSLSGAIDLQVLTLVGLQFPAAWTAASVTFSVSPDGVTYAALWDESAEVALTSPAAAVYVALNPAKYAGVRFLKVRSGTSGSPVAQGADRLVGVVARVLE